MDRISLFSSPLFLGFDHFERLIDTMSKTHEESYPPHNIEQIGDTDFRITLALAGFKKEHIQISLEDNKLTIKGKHDEQKNKVFLYRGIANRQFIRNFILADGMEVKNAEFDNGLLHINIVRIRNESRVRKIEIDQPPQRTTGSKKLMSSADDDIECVLSENLTYKTIGNENNDD